MPLNNSEPCLICGKPSRGSTLDHEGRRGYVFSTFPICRAHVRAHHDRLEQCDITWQQVVDWRIEFHTKLLEMNAKRGAT